MPYEPQSVDETAINTIRVLAADVVSGANSGHPGKLNPTANVIVDTI